MKTNDSNYLLLTNHNVPPCEVLLVPRDRSENIDIRFEIGNDFNEWVEVLALVLHEDRARASAAITTAVDDPPFAAAVDGTATRDARDAVDARDRRAVRAGSCRPLQEGIWDRAAATWTCWHQRANHWEEKREQAYSSRGQC